MPSTYSNLKIQLMATGENTTTWGDITNVNLGTALEEAIAGSADVTFASNNQTLTLTDTNATQTARNMRLRCTGTTGGSTRDLVVPTIEKPYIVQNDCADSVVVKTSAGTGITVPAGKTMWVYADGTNVVDATTHLTSLTLGTALAVAQGGTGVTTSTGTTAVVLSNSPTLVTPTLGAASATSIANGLGAVGTPAYTFTGDLNTGMWSPGADTLAFSEGGVEAMRINSAGNVGIGTSSPAQRLHVNSTGNTVLQISTSFSNSTATGVQIDQPGDDSAARILFSKSGAARGSIRFNHNAAPSLESIQLLPANTVTYEATVNTTILRTANTERMRIDSSGNVGIGTSSPGSKLDVRQDTNGATAARVINADTGASAGAQLLVSNGTVQSGMIMRGTGHASANHFVLFQSSTTEPMTFFTNGSERMRIDSSGDVGIGTNNPLFPLHVNGEVRGTKFTSDAASQSLANATDLAVLTLTGNPGPQVYQVSVGVNAAGSSAMTVALVTVSTNGSGGRDATVTQLVNGTNTDVTVTNAAGTSTVNVQQTTGATQTISWSITRLM